MVSKAIYSSNKAHCHLPQPILLTLSSQFPHIVLAIARTCIFFRPSHCGKIRQWNSALTQSLYKLMKCYFIREKSVCILKPPIPLPKNLFLGKQTKKSYMSRLLHYSAPCTGFKWVRGKPNHLAEGKLLSHASYKPTLQTAKK